MVLPRLAIAGLLAAALQLPLAADKTCSAATGHACRDGDATTVAAEAVSEATSTNSLLSTKNIVHTALVNTEGTAFWGYEEEEKEEMSSELEDGARYFDDLKSAKERLFQEAHTREEAAHRVFLQAFEEMLGTSLGGDGQAVVILFKDVNQPPCKGLGYLHETFVHADMVTGTFVCKPCHASCVDHCTGPNKQDCFEQEARRGVSLASTTSRSGSGSAFADSFQMIIKSQVQQDMQMGESLLSVDPANTSLPENVTMCVQKGTCTVETLNATETYILNLSGLTAEFVFATSLGGNVSDPAQLKYEVQKSLNQVLKDAGFVPGLTEEIELTADTVGAPPANESGPPDSEISDAGVLTQAEEPGLLQACMAAEKAKANRTYRSLSSTIMTRIKGTSKDYVRTQAKRAAQNYAKMELKAWLFAQDGPCVDALDMLVGASQEIYGCFKENYAQLDQAFCTPPKIHAELLTSLSSAVTTANILETVTSPLRYLPYIGGAARTIYSVSGQVKAKLSTPVQKLKNMKVQSRGPNYQDTDCCYPFPTSSCHGSVNALYKCASCDSGSMCYTQRGCNTLRKMEQKIDTWKARYYDPLLEKVADAVQHVQAGVNAVNTGSYLFSCGIQSCNDVKKITEKIVQDVRSKFTDKYCPLTPPSIPMPNIDPLRTVLGWLGSIGNVFNGINIVLGKLHCVYIPRVRFETRNVCNRVCIPCCSYRGRRRWAGSVQCNSCCTEICIPVAYVVGWMERFCFSAMDILKGIAGFIQTFLGPILNIIDLAIKALLAPVNALFGLILQKLDISFDVNFPSLPDFSFDLPTLPSVECGVLKSYA